MDSNITPQVSIIMSTYNDEAYVKECIESVLNQDFSNFEYIIIDDASTDNTKSIVHSFNDPRIVYLRNETNKGLIVNLNAGLDIVKGTYIARIDSDDAWVLPTKLSAQIAYLEAHPECGLVGTRANVHNESGKQLFTTHNPLSDSAIRNTMLMQNPFVHSSVVFRSSLAQACGRYNEQEKYVEDYGLWMRMGTRAQVANLDMLAVYYRLNGTGITQTKNKKQIRANKELIRSHKEAYPHYMKGMCRWNTKAFFVQLGLLPLINTLKQHRTRK